MSRPLREGLLDETVDRLGLKLISVVENPAIQIEFVRMSEAQEKERIKLSKSGSKDIIFTPVLIPDQKIARVDESGNEYDLFFTAETIEKIAIKWQKDHLGTAADIQHSESLIPGVTWFESVLMSSDRWTENKHFKGYPMGTWFVTGKIENQNLLSQIDSGELKGVSIDGLFMSMKVKAREDTTQINITEEDFKNILKQYVQL